MAPPWRLPRNWGRLGALILLASEELGEGWVELHYQLEDITETQTRVQLVINGTAVQRPRLKNLRVALT